MQAAQAKAQSKACKRASTFPTQRRISNFFPTLFKKNKTHDTEPDNEHKLNTDNGIQTRWTRTPAGNMNCAKNQIKIQLFNGLAEQ